MEPGTHLIFRACDCCLPRTRAFGAKPFRSVHFCAAPLLALAVGMTEMPATPADDREAGGAVDSNAIVSVAEILDRRVAVAWYESVAIVAGLCATLVEDRVPGAPAPHNVLLSADGTIAVGGRGRNQDSAALPRLLHELLAVMPPPTPLRLFVLHAIASGGDRSPAAFGQALAYYERPGRAELIQAVRQRCLETPIAEPEPAEADVEIPEPEIEIVAPRPRPSRRRRRLVAAGMVMCASAIAVVVAAGRRPGPHGSMGPMSTFDAVVAHVAESGRGVAHAIAEGLFGTGSQHETTQASTTTPPPSAPSRRRRPRGKATEITPVAEAGHEGAPAVVAGAPADHQAEPPADFADAGEVDETETPIQQETADAVVPPRLLDPIRLPPWAQPARDSSLNVIELDISESGAVDRVRMVSPAMRLTDMMILSAAKTWLFEPASKDGRPVPYRLTLNWVAPNP